MTAEDACQGEITPVFTEQEFTPSEIHTDEDYDSMSYGVDDRCMVSYVKRKWKITDGCGNSRKRVQFIFSMTPMVQNSMKNFQQISR